MPAIRSVPSAVLSPAAPVTPSPFPSLSPTALAPPATDRLGRAPQDRLLRLLRTAGRRATDGLQELFPVMTTALVSLLLVGWLGGLRDLEPGWPVLGVLLLAAARVRAARFHLLCAALAVAAAVSPETTGESTLTVVALAALAVMRAPRSQTLVPVVAGCCGLLLSSEPVALAALGLVAGTGVGLVVRGQASRTEQLHERTRRSEHLAVWLEQRTALARELHDVVGHHVTAMVVQAEAGKVGDPQEALSRIGELGRTALGELDSLVVHLRDPDRADVAGSPPRLEDVEAVLVAPLRAKGIDVAVEQEHVEGVSEVCELAAYRIVQEGLTNVLRHSGAGRAWVTVGAAAGHLRLCVEDDGRGPGHGTRAGAGLTGIGERVAGLGGVWSLSARPLGGTRLDVFLPLQPPAARP